MEYKEEKLSRAISAYSRRQILKLLVNKEMTVKNIANSTKMSVSLASRHLKMLYDLGFLNVRKEFPNKFYSLKQHYLEELLDIYDKVVNKCSLSNAVEEEKLSRAISAYSRRQILRLISDKEFIVKDIAEQTNQSVSLASRHLKMLYDLGFLNVRKEFPNKFYFLKVKEMKKLLVVYDKVISKI
jgi:DNA-binding transcriptional ArsR family regulator